MRKLWERLPGTAIVLLAALLWTSTPLFIKGATLAPMQIAVYRSFVAAVLLLPFFRPRRIRLSYKTLLLVFSYAGMTLLLTSAYKYTAATNAIALHFSAPMWVFVFAALRSRKFNLRGLPAVLLVLAGIIITLIEPKAGSNQIGNMMGALSGFCFGIFTTVYDEVAGQDRFNYMFVMNLSAALIMLAFSPLLAPGLSLSPALIGNQWWLLLGMAVFLQTVPYYLFGVGLSKLPATRVSMLALTEFVLSPVWVAIFFGEMPSLFGFIGWCLVFAGLISNVLLSRPAPQTADIA